MRSSPLPFRLTFPPSAFAGMSEASIAEPERRSHPSADRKRLPELPALVADLEVPSDKLSDMLRVKSSTAVSSHAAVSSRRDASRMAGIGAASPVEGCKDAGLLLRLIELCICRRCRIER